jgi:FMN phosphatase YigB (HAD superfamily)
MTALRADPACCWYVGDSRAKDVECGRRAGVATVVLVGAADPDDRGPDADLCVNGCAELHDVLRHLANPRDAARDTGRAAAWDTGRAAGWDTGRATGWDTGRARRLGHRRAHDRGRNETMTSAPPAPPRAVLLDHGGVVVRSVKDPDGLARFATGVHQILADAGAEVPDEAELLADIQAGLDCYKSWKNGNVRRPHPREIGHREFWVELVAADWPEAARTLVGAEATPLCRAMVESRGSKELGPGMREFFEFCAQAGVRTGIVANTMVGAINRDLARAWGTEKYLAVQVHSDETGIRKPDPEAIWLATRALDLEPAQVWFVGDNYDRDVRGARRAGVGRAVLMRPPDQVEPSTRPQPDDVVSDGFGLTELLRAAVQGATEDKGGKA